ncbi:non-ribosomal peptide synthetase [Tumebacillus avium]|nr:non-ribosomal peptide synthetase [Tumebacillus avium]
MSNSELMQRVLERRARLSPEKQILLEQRMNGIFAEDVQGSETGIPRRSGTGAARLSFAQQRLWFLDRLEPGSAAYNIPTLVRLSGPLDVQKLTWCLNEIVRRHEALRTTFVEVQGEPIQVIAEEAVLELTTAEAGELHQEAQKAFDLQQGPLVRAVLASEGEEEHLLLLTLHHIVADGWSLGVLVKEMAALYSGTALPALAVQYADFAEWQRGQLQGDALEKGLRYWKEQLGGEMPVLQLPTDRPRPPVQTTRGGAVRLELPAQVTADLKELGKQTGATLNMVLLAVFKTLLFRYTGQEDLRVGTPVAGRRQREVEGLIGFFVNTLVMRTHPSRELTFRELLTHVRQVSLDGDLHQDVPFEKLVEELQPERNLSVPPLFKAMFVHQIAPETPPALAGLTVQREEVETGTAQFDLTLYALEEASLLKLTLEYNADLFDRETAERMAGHVQVLVDGILSAPDTQLGQLPFVGAEERKKLLGEWTATGAAFEELCLHEWFERQVEETPLRTAVEFSGENVSYRELNRRANRLAHLLRAKGVGPDVPVGLCMERSVEMIVALLAVLKAGGAYVALDPGYPQSRLAFLLQDTQVPVVVTQAHLHSLLPEHAAEVVVMEEAACAGQSEANPVGGVTPEHLLYVLYTSGSTGVPKGVEMPHKALSNLLSWQRGSFALQGAVKTLQFTALHFDVACQEIFSTLCSGGTLVVPSEEVRREPRQLLELVAETGVERMFLPFIALQQLAESAVSAGLVTGLKEIVTAGEQLQMTSQIVRFLDGMSGCVLHNQYGPSETHVVTAYTLQDGVQTALPPIGKPISNVQAYVLDESLQPVPVGVQGELYIGGAALARGYWHRADLTEERFLPSPFADGERFYRTGDLARWLADGNLEFLGRADQQVKIRGHRIEPGEVEAALCEHLLVQEAAVTAREDVPGHKRLVAYVVGDAPPNELKLFLQGKLPEYMVPSVIVSLEKLPLTASGKVDRRALPAPEPEAGMEPHYVAPRTPAEAALAAIWQEVLGVEQVGVHDNFFARGGHSLLATQVVSRIAVQWDVDLPLKKLFESPTLEALALAVGQAKESHTPPVVPLAGDGALPLSFAQERVLFFEQLEPGTPIYHIAGALRMQGDLDVEKLALCFNQVVARHESLRTVFTEEDGVTKAAVLPSMHIEVPIEDVQAHSHEQILELAGQEIRQAFDLATGPLLRVRLYRSSAQDHLLALTLHHIIADGWSLGVLMEEISALYGSSELELLPVQYADYAAWQKAHGHGQEQTEYWKEQLHGPLPILQLPTDRPRPAVQTYRGETMRFMIPDEVASQLQQLCQREGVTLFMALLAAFQTLLHRYTGQEDILVGTPVAGRSRQEIEGLIGFFVNTLVLRTDLSGAPTFAELLARVRETAVGAYAHGELPFEKLVEELQPERNRSVSPLFQVMFVLQNAPFERLSFPGLTLTPVEVEAGTAKFDLTLFMAEEAGRLSAALEYNADLFDRATAERMAGHLQTLLSAMVQEPQRSVALVPLLTAGEQEVLNVLNQTKADFVREICVHRLIEEQAARTPDAIAVVCGAERLTYRQLDQKANALSHRLAELGVGPDVLVGLYLERSVEMAVALLAVWKAGGAYVPIDPAYPLERTAFVLEDAQVPVLLTQERLSARLPGTSASIICIDGVAEESAMPAASGVTSSHLAYVIYTSGSTGRPKGVLIEHRGLVNYLTWAADAYAVREGIGAPVHSSLAFDLTVTSLLTPLISGGQVVMVPETEDLTALGDALLAQTNFGVVKITPAHLQLLGDHLRPEQLAGRTRTLVIGGEALPADLLAVWREHAPETLLVNEYGPTETVVGCSIYTVTSDTPAAGIVPIGKPITNTELYILDGHLQQVPLGVTGELYIGGAGVARGYLNRPELTAERFLPNPFGSGRLYKTGDLARLRPDGNLEFLGRTDDQVKVRGFRIELGEIESALLEHPSVQEAVVLARDGQLIAYIVGQNEDLRGFLKQKLPDYMVPPIILTLDRLPLTTNGKVDKKALPAPDHTDSRPAYTAPRTPVEQKLAEIWAQLLQVEQVGIHDNFFDLGGHSLLASQLVARVRSGFGVEVQLRHLFEVATVAELAVQIETLQATAVPKKEEPKMARYARDSYRRKPVKEDGSK